MNMMDMVMAMLAVVFFTSVSLVYNRSMWTQIDNITEVSLVVQATQLCHSILDEVDAKLFAKMTPFASVNTEYTFDRDVTYSFINQTFSIHSVAVDCDSLGTFLNNPPANNQFKSVTVTVSGPRGLRRPVTLRRIYTKTSMYS